MFKWFLQNALKNREILSVLNGLNALLKVAQNYEFGFQVTQVEPLFIIILDTYIDDKKSGELAGYYFTWAIHQQKDLRLDKYLNWVTLHYEGKQTPFVFAHLLSSILDNLDALLNNFSQLEQIWSVLRLLISNRLESEGTVVAVQNFCRYVVYFQDMLPIGDKTLINKLSEEFYQLVLKLDNHPNVYKLLINMPSFSPDLLELPDYPSTQQILSLWHKLGLKCVDNLDDDAAIAMIRRIDQSLSSDDEARGLFRQDLVESVKLKPGHSLSPALAGIVLNDNVFVSEHPSFVQQISAVLPLLIRFQQDLKEVGYPLGQCLRYLSLILTANTERAQYESSILDLLENNFQKPNSEECLAQVIKYSTWGIHAERFTLLLTKDIYRKHWLRNTKINDKILGEFYEYTEGYKSNEARDIFRNAVRNLLEAIQENEPDSYMPQEFSILIKYCRMRFSE